jgi:outer membrane protein OmpA-like peptidoglycan-associated protein
MACAGILAATSLHAQVDTTGPTEWGGFRVGLYGGYQTVRHETDIAGIPSLPTCAPGFDGGSGTGSAFGGLIQYPFSEIFAVQLRLGYSTSKGKFSVEENIGNVMESGVVVPAVSEHTLDLDLALIDAEPMLMAMPFSFPLTLGLGMQFGSISQRDYEQKETLVRPTGITFYGGRTYRNQYKREFTESSSLHIAGIGAIGYEVKAGPRITIGPEISYRLGFTNLLKDTAWKMHALRFTGIMKVRLGAIPVQATPPPPVVEALPLSATVTASALQAGNAEEPIAQIQVEEFLTAQLRPLLNYVFFDDGSAELPDRYVKMTQDQTSSFGIGNLSNVDVLPTYYQILNVVGRRLQESPGAALTITGCNSDAGADMGNTVLSRQRAEAVRDYLRDIWSIPVTRLRIEARDLPEKPSNTTDPDGIAENRRVELHSDDPTILEPVFTNDTLRTSNPPSVRFRPGAQTEVGVKGWKLIASQGGRTLKEFNGSGAVPATIDWRLEQTSIPRSAGPIEYRLEVTSTDGQTYTTQTARLPVDQITVQRKREERVADKEVNRYSLILFDFGKSDISEPNRRIIDFIKSRITPSAEVKVTGHTDRVGEDAFNQKLSQERAAATARVLGVTNASIEGLGESRLLYNNDLPEGRFYCRVVNVVVETPLNE